jgi:hypothetical protein
LLHFYGLKRSEALQLPHWEFVSLIENSERISAKKNADSLTAINAGFNGNNKLYERLIEFSKPYKKVRKMRDLPADAGFDDIFNFQTIDT